MNTVIKHIVFLFLFLIINLFVVTDYVREFCEYPYGVLDQKLKKVYAIDAIILVLYLVYTLKKLSKNKE